MKPFYLIFASLFVALPLWALSIDVQSAKEAGTLFSTVHLKNSTPFICQETLDEFRVVTKVECYFEHAPQKEITPIGNGFFSIKSFRTPKLFVVEIIPHARMKLFPIAENIATTKRIMQESKRLVAHWMIVGYKEHLPLFAIHELPENGLNFPIDFHRSQLPSVGALGLDGTPIELDQVADVTDYIEVRKYFAREQYSDVLRTIEEILQKEPHTIFKSELLLYKLRTEVIFDELGDMIDTGKMFLREFSSDEALPEVLYNLAFANGKIGMVTDAEYFYDRLLTEHYDSSFATQGLLSLGDHILAKGEVDKALYFYNEALRKAETKALASEAAMKLTNYYMAKGDAENASYYVQKIADANLPYLLENFEDSYAIAKEFGDREAYDKAAALATKLWETLDVNDPLFEPMMYQIAVWQDMAGENAKAYELYKAYTQKFAFGDFLNDVEERMDKVLFKMGEANTTKQLELFDTIQEKYADQEIAKQALYNKAKLLAQEGKDGEILAIEKELAALDKEKYPDVATLISQSALHLTMQALDAKKCQEAIVLLRRYEMNVSMDYSEPLYACTMQESDFNYARKTSEPFIKDSNLTKRLAWLYRYVKASAKIGDHKTVFVMGEDLMNLAAIEKNTQYQDILKERFKAALALGEEEAALDLIRQIETVFGLQFLDIELYMDATKLAQKRNDPTMIEAYAQKVITLQQANQSYTQSPSIEYIMLHALKKMEKFPKAYEVSVALSKIVKAPKEKARAFYELGSAAQKIGKNSEAKAAFETSAKADDASPWAKLSSDTLKLLP